MLIYGLRQVERCEERGEFTCPQCQARTTFRLCRVYNYWHIYFIPILRQSLLAEQVRCDSCFTPHPITVLVRHAASVVTSFDAGQSAGPSLEGNFGNVVSLSDAATTEIVRRHREGKFAPDVAVRVMPGDSPANYSVVFDYV